MNAFQKMTSNQLFRVAWLCSVAMVMAGCGGNDRQTAGVSDRGAASGSSAPRSELHAATTSPQEADGLWRQGAVLNAVELQAAEEAAVQRSSAYQSGASLAAAKAATNRLAVYRFFNSQTAAHFYTSSATERDRVIASLPQFRYEGLAFWAAASASGGMSPVYRFFNSQTGVHFYTISEPERDHIQANLPQLRYEGVAYYASKTAGADLFPLYRFYLAGKGFHFYTRSASEAAGVRATQPQYLDEGVSYYLPPAAPSGSPAPTLNLAVDVTRVAPDGSTTLTWSSTGATDCSASGGWTGTRGISGSAGTGSHTSSTVFTLVCSGAGGSVARSLRTFMGRSHVQIGAITNDTNFSAAPFDVRYQYIGGAAPLQACMVSCKSHPSCGGWWGCWQWNELPPGSQYPTQIIRDAAAATWQGQPRPQLVYWTYNSIRSFTGNDGMPVLDNLNNSTIMTRYFNDWRFLLQKIGTDRTVLHIEPDLWGFVRSANSGNPHGVPARVTSTNPTDCPNLENSAVGFARCLIAMVRKYAPNASVGLHASPWTYMANGDGTAVGQFMLDLGAGEGDFVATDPSDRDAGWYATQGRDAWWDDQKFAGYLSWSKALAERAGKPTIMWQIPLGNPAQNNTYQHYQDNKIEYVFQNANDVGSAHIVGLLFGPGDAPQTNTATDGGNLYNKTINLWNAGGAPIR